MRLTRFSDIGLRILMYLVQERESRTPVTAAEVASQFNVPPTHLMKVSSVLARAGWIDAVRGRNGGMRLRADPRTLPIGGVLRFLEGNDGLIDCEGLACRLRGDCTLRHALNEAHDAFYAAMDRHTLASIVDGGLGDQIVMLHRTVTSQTGIGRY